MNIAPNTTTSAAAASGSTAASISNNIKRSTVANTNAAASYLDFPGSSSSSSTTTSTGSPPPSTPSLGQYFNSNNKNVNNKKSRQGGHNKIHHHHHHVGSKKTLLSLSSSSSSSSSSLVSNSRTWKESDFALDGLLGEGHFGKIYRAYCYPRSFIMTGSSSSNNGNNGLPRKLGISVSASSNANTNTTGAATDKNTTTCLPNTVALKRFSRGRIADAQQRGSRFIELLQREINIHSNLQHPCIISFLGHYVDHNHLTLVLEYAAFGDLYGYMALAEQQQQPEGMSLAKRIDTARTVMSQMTAAVAHLQQLYVAHRDIKSENVLLVETAPPSPPSSGAATNSMRAMPVPTVFKLCDFGWAVSYQGFISGRLSTLCGTPEYVPPEMLGPNRFYRGEFVDPWALGVLAYELVVGVTPFYLDDENENYYHGCTCSTGGSSHGQRDEEMDTNTTTTNGSCSSRKKNTVDRIFDNIRNFRELELPFVDNVDEDYIDLVQGFLQVEPMHRRLAGDCLNHAFFQKAGSNRRGHGASSVGQKENILEKYQHDSTAPTVSQRCELWNKQKQFGIWPGSEQEI